MNTCHPEETQTNVILKEESNHHPHFVLLESSILQLEDPDCEEGSNPPCESVFSLNAEKILVRKHTHTHTRVAFI